MPILEIKFKGQTTKQPIFKSVTTIGADPHADIHIDDDQIPEVVAHIIKKKKNFVLCGLAAKYPIYLDKTAIQELILKKQTNYYVIFLNEI